MLKFNQEQNKISNPFINLYVDKLWVMEVEIEVYDSRKK